jgi:hypothetical protein
MNAVALSGGGFYRSDRRNIMALSRLAQEFADEISAHDWSDAPYRLDRAGHRREYDSTSKLSETTLTEAETSAVRTNVMWVVAQVLGHADSTLDPIEFAAACGVNHLAPGIIKAGLRTPNGSYDKPGGVTRDRQTK